MPSLLKITRGALCGWLVFTATNLAVAAKPSDALLPDTTRGYVSVASISEFRESWEQTQFGQLMSDPVMEGFLEDFKTQLRDRFTTLHEKVGIDWEDLIDIPSGEISFAILQPTSDTTAIVALVDVTDNTDEARNLLDKIDRRLIERGATKNESESHGATVTIYDLPDDEDESKKKTVVFFLHDDTLCVSDNQEAVTAILGRWSGKAADSLSSLPAYQWLMARCKKDAGSLEPELRWFVDPFGLVDAVRLRKITPRKQGKDIVKILERQGFSAYQGVGGYLNFYVDKKYELMHRTAVFAPPVEGRSDKNERYEFAARMLSFPNGDPLTPQSWVPREVATYTSFNWEVAKAFDYAETLVDDIILGRDKDGNPETGAFRDILDDIRDQEFGPQVDIRKDLVAHLGNRVTIISDFEVPITPKSERMLLAIETTNEKKLAEAIKKNMDTDPNALEHEYNGHVVWEIVEEGEELPDFQIAPVGLPPPVGINGFNVPPGQVAKAPDPNRSVAVALGHLMVASNIDLLKTVLDARNPKTLLRNTADYQLIDAEIEKLAPDPLSIRFFSRTDDEYRPIYDLIRDGRMPEAETTLGQVLNEFLGEDEEGVLRTQKIDGSKLPDFQMVRRYLGPAGLAVRSEENGWFLIGFTLNKEAP